MQTVLDAVAERLLESDESLIRIPDICEATGVNYGSVYHHFGSREGVIDAAYAMIFSQYVDNDMQLWREILEKSVTFEDYLALIYPISVSLNSGPDRRERRAMRTRICAAATARPHLRATIGATQARITAEMTRIIEYSQERGWIRDDVTARSLALLIQVLTFGRVLDDISNDPIDEKEWEASLALLLIDQIPAEHRSKLYP
jgi:AcrR family transcriptional regulator